MLLKTKKFEKRSMAITLQQYNEKDEGKNKQTNTVERTLTHCCLVVREIPQTPKSSLVLPILSPAISETARMLVYRGLLS